MIESIFKAGDRVYMLGPGWGTVFKIASTGSHNGHELEVVFDSDHRSRPYSLFTLEGAYYRSWEPTLMTKEEALKAGIKDPKDEPKEKEVKVYQWEKMFVPKEGDPPHQYRGEVIVQQSVFMGPKGCWAERQGWTIVPGSERTLHITKEGEVYDKASRNN